MTDQIKLNTLTHQQFQNKLKGRSFENLKLIKSIDQYFTDKRSYVFQMPKPGTPIILLYSGGLDSTVAWALLMAKYKLQVYPLIMSGGKITGQTLSVRFFKHYFKKQFPRLYHEPFIFNQGFIPHVVYQQLNNSRNFHPATLLRYVNQDLTSMNFLPGLTALAPLSGLIYAKYLESKNNLLINTIFSAVLASDGHEIPSQSFTYLRKTMLFLDELMPSNNLQISSLFLEEQTGMFYEKKDIIDLGSKSLNLPLEKTFSCYKNKLLHCGRCLGCYSRQLEFNKASVLDKTTYYSRLRLVKLLGQVRSYLSYFLSRER